MAFTDPEEFDKRRMRREELRNKRRQEQKKLIMGLVAAAIVLIGCGVLIFVLSRGDAVQQPTEPPVQTDPVPSDETQPVLTEPTESQEETETRSDKETVIHILAGGDLNVTDNTVASGGVTYDYTKAFQDVLPLLSQADYSILNFEGSLCGEPYGTLYRSAPQRMMEALKLAGVDMLQMANSCAIVNGTSGLQRTLAGIEAAGLDTTGAYANNAEFRRTGGYLIRNIGGVKVGFVSFTKGMDGMALPTGSENCVNVLYTDYATTYQKIDRDGISAVLKALSREKPDITIALVHWGSEFNDNHSDTQESIKKLMLEQGVDAIIGTHPHYVQSIEFDAEAGTLVAYSLGDFFSDAERSGTEYSILLDLEIVKNTSTGVTRLESYSYTPIFTVAEEGKPLKVVRLMQAMEAYENTHVDRVTKETYEDMQYALTRIGERVKPVVAEED